MYYFVNFNNVSVDERYERTKELERQFIEKCLKVLFPKIDINVPFDSGTNITGFKNEIHHFGFSISNTDYYNLIPDIKPDTNKFIHFTSLQGLYNIFKSQCIRLYSINNLNDPNEFKLFDKATPGTDWSILKNSVYCLSLINSTIQNNSQEILNLWRLYGNSGYGAFVEFEIGNLFPSQNGPLLANVLYQNEEHIDNFISSIKDFEKNNSLSFNHSSKLNILKYYSMLYKSELFKHENEVRMFYFLDSTAAQIAPPNERIFPDLNRRNEIVYYKEWSFEHDLISNFPTIRPIKVQFGFNCSLELINTIQESLNLYFLNSEFILPPFELSPLGKVFIN